MSTAKAKPIVIPVSALSEDLLTAIIEGFVLREGTDYGASEVPLATKIRQVRQALNRGEVVLTFDPESESTTICSRHELRGPGVEA